MDEGVVRRAHAGFDVGRDSAFAGPFTSGDEGLRFVGPLHELCAIGLYRPAMEALCAGGEPPEPNIDRGYLLKILREEVRRQFGHPLRPLVELVLNAVDGSRGHVCPVIDVAVTDGQVEVMDRGEGMGLRTLLSRLLVPFATDRRAGIDLGRFGVGFFSVLGLGLSHPSSFSLHLVTGDGREGWSVRVIPGYEAPGVAGDEGALMCSVRRIEPRLGTEVQVTSEVLAPEAVRAYLRDVLHFFPAERALVRMDGVPVNDGSLIAGGRRFEDHAGCARGGAPIVGRFHLGGRAMCTSISAATYHAGVRVEPCLTVAELALIDFPATVELTEARDALKPGPALDAVARAFYRRLIRLAEEAGADRAERDRLAELAGQISALMLKEAAWSDAAAELSAALLGPGRYLVSPERREALIGFLGAGMAERLFVPESFWAERQWQPLLPGERELLDRELDIDPPEALASLAAARSDLGGLALLAARAPSPEIVAASLCRGRHPAGPLPCFGTRRVLLIRDDSPVVRRPNGWRDRYALRAAFDRAAGVREADFERDLIVGEVLRGAQEPYTIGGVR